MIISALALQVIGLALVTISAGIPDLPNNGSTAELLMWAGIALFLAGVALFGAVVLP